LDLTRINNLNDLQKLLELLGRFEVSEFEIESEGVKIRIAKGRAFGAPGGLAVLPAATGISMAPVAAGNSPPAAASGAPTSRVEVDESLPANIKIIKSPMVGTFYRAPSPESDPFVQVGDRIEDDAVLCIIEAMKVMNEIPAGVAGVVKEILVKNGESVEFGQPLFHIQT
jgi:acetyl-CoA carboxylase biotin carboxyl carrier protein